MPQVCGQSEDLDDVVSLPSLETTVLKTTLLVVVLCAVLKAEVKAQHPG